MEQQLCVIKSGLSLHQAEHTFLFLMNHDQNIDLCSLRVDYRGHENAVVCDADDTQRRLGVNYYARIEHFRAIADAYLNGYNDGWEDGFSND